jgi:hypothetical protein
MARASCRRCAGRMRSGRLSIPPSYRCLSASLALTLGRFCTGAIWKTKGALTISRFRFILGLLKETDGADDDQGCGIRCLWDPVRCPIAGGRHRSGLPRLWRDHHPDLATQTTRIHLAALADGKRIERNHRGTLFLLRAGLPAHSEFRDMRLATIASTAPSTAVE